jgi:hypothetical protein
MPPALGQMHFCPEPGKWSVATWSGPDATPLETALASCPNQVNAAYRIDPDTQAWTRYFRGRPEITNLAAIDDDQGVLALGSGVSAASATGDVPLRAAANGMLGCPQPGKWAISVWSGASGTPTDQALASCATSSVAAAYWIEPQTQAWKRYFHGRPDISNLTTLDEMQGVIALGVGPTPSPTPMAWLAPITFSGWVVGGCPQPGEEGGCSLEIEVEIRDVTRMEQTDASFEYAPGEVITVILWPWGTESVPDLAAGDLVEVSGQERLYGDCVEGLCWDAYGFVVLPDGGEGNYISRL